MSTATQTVPAGTTTSTEASAKPNLRQQIVGLLAKLPDGQTMTIEQIQEALSEGKAMTDEDKKKFKNVVQSTVSQMKANKKVEKVTTGSRMPGYTLPKPKPATTPTV